MRILNRSNISLYGVLLAIIVLLTNCNTSKLPSQNITGNWAEKEAEDVMQMVGASHYFKFFDDHTFHLELQLWTDMIIPGQACTDNRVDYITGSYKIKGQQLKLTGKYCDSNFATITPNCKGKANFKSSYIANFKTEQIILDPTAPPELQVLLVKQ